MKQAKHFRAALFGTSLMHCAGPGERVSFAEGVSQQAAEDAPLDDLSNVRARLLKRVPPELTTWLETAARWFELQSDLGEGNAARAAHHVKCNGAGACMYCQFCSLSRRCGLGARVVGAPEW